MSLHGNLLRASRQTLNKSQTLILVKPPLRVCVQLGADPKRVHSSRATHWWSLSRHLFNDAASMLLPRHEHMEKFVKRLPY